MGVHGRVWTERTCMMDAKSTLDKFAKAAGFAGGAHWMYNNALMFVKPPDPTLPTLGEDTNDWLYVRTSLAFLEPKHGSAMQDVLLAQSWNDAAAKVYRALDKDSLYVGWTKISKSSCAAAEFMVECSLLGLG